MALTSGARIGPYHVVAWLGAGGMGEVYHARDPRLLRDVAIKVIPDRFAADPRRVHRFEQEARAAGQLNHPNILAVLDVGVQDGASYIVSELLEGASLRTHLRAGPLPMRRAVAWARQIAEGLAAAHARGIVHRDLKPENLFVASDDRIKILDFGLAKLTHPNDAEALPQSGDTEVGTLVGTVGYMSPEQVRGEALDVRSDIFSFGIIFHEMLAGSAPFARPTAADTMAAILKEHPAGALPPTLPPALERVVTRCLEKAREMRFQSARDLAFGLEVLAPSSTSTATLSGKPRARWLRRMLPWAASAALVAAVILAIRREAPSPSTAPPVRLTADLGADAPLGRLSRQFGNTVAISPDGSTLAFVVQKDPATAPLLYVRRFAETRANVLPGTEDAEAPFFSPDGRWIGFETGSQIKKVAVTGGAPIVLAPALSSRGSTWGDDGTIVFSPSSNAGTRLMRMPAMGGAPESATTLNEGEAIHAWPQVLPGASAVLYTSSRVPSSYNDANLLVQPLPAGTPKVIQRGGFHGRYVRSGHIVYVRDGSLFALPFDLGRLEAAGPPVRVIDALASNAITGGAQFSISETGTLVYLTGPSIGAGTPLDLVDRHGQTSRLRDTAANWLDPSFAPDGERVALELREGPSQPASVWVHQAGHEVLHRLTPEGSAAGKPVWTPDGRRITFASDPAGGAATNLYWSSADGSGVAQRLTSSPNEQRPGMWHPSGRFLAFDELRTTTLRDVMILPMEGDDRVGWRPGTPTVFVDGPQMDWEPAFSPDGHWLAYASADAGRWEVFVRPFPGPGPAVQVSTGGGELPTWSRTRHEIVYGREGQVMIVPFTVDGGRFKVDRPRPWPGGRYQTRGRIRMFDLNPDGEHLVLALPSEASAGTREGAVQIVFNFFDELRRLAPPARR